MSHSDQGGGMGGGLVPGTYPPPNSLRPTLFGSHWSVVAGHPLVSQVAANVFEAGGNAIDAGVAAGLASNVVQVDMANFGGIAPIVFRTAADHTVRSVAGVGRWSKTVTLDAVVNRYAGALPLGGAPSIVPGAPAAWLRALEIGGTMSLGDVASQAIVLARDGFALDQRTATSLAITGRGFSQWPSSNDIYRPGDIDPVAGQLLIQPALASLLQSLVDAEASGARSRVDGIRRAHDAFYRGDVAQIMSRFVVENGGWLTPDDFASFDAECEPALAAEVWGWNFGVTPSWSQGPVALEILGLLERLPATEHSLVEAITLAFNDREDFLAAPGQMSADVDWLLSSGRLDELAALVGPGALSGRPGSPRDPAGSLSSTTAVVTMDQAGNVFATSPSDTLDGGPIIPQLGIMCSPRGVQSRLHPDHPNRLVPGGRPVVTPAAMIGNRGDELWALACPGGDVIVQAIVQVIARVERDGLDLQEAVEAPRIAAFNAPSAFHPHPSADRLVFVEGRMGDDVVDQLRQGGHRVEVWPDYEFDAGSVQTIKSFISQAGSTVLTSAADPRRSAYALSR